MATISKPNTFSAGAVIVASEHNSNFDTIYNDYNTNITNVNIASGAAIVDTKLAQLTTAGKVNLSALVISSQAAGDIIYASSASTLTRLAAGFSGQYLRSAGTAAPTWAAAGKVLQVVNITTATTSVGTGVFVVSNVAPSSTQGNQFMTLAITPAATANKLRIEATAHLEANGGGEMIMALFQDSTTAAISTVWEEDGSNGFVYNMKLSHYMDAATTAETTFKIRAGATAGSTSFNTSAATAPVFGGTLASHITITEINS